MHFNIVRWDTFPQFGLGRVLRCPSAFVRNNSEISLPVHAPCVVCSVPGARVQGLESLLSVLRRRGGRAGPRVRYGLETVSR